MENNEINNLLKEALKEHAEKNNITTEVLYDEAMGDDGKISIWKSLKSFWKPKNWFNYKGYVSREKYWKTILGNILLGFGVSIALIILTFLIISLFPTSVALFGFTAILWALFIPFGLCSNLAFFALLMKRANCAGIHRGYVWGFYIIPVILSTLAPMVLILLQNPISNLGSLLNYVSFGALIGIGVMQNKFLEYRKVSALKVLSKGDAIQNEVQNEEEFFKK